jgi:RNA polymerase sigma-70 factor, ECF subfamily
VPPDTQLLESALLVVRWQRGDREAFAGIVQLWERSLFYYLRRLAPTEADAWELLQETWLKTLRSLHTLRDPRTLPSYLYTIARNTALSRFRTRDFESEAYPENIPDHRADADGVAFDNAEQVHHALAKLSLPQREALTLFFLQDLSLDEMANVLDVPIGTVKSRLHYAKLALRNILSPGDDHGR